MGFKIYIVLEETSHYVKDGLVLKHSGGSVIGHADELEKIPLSQCLSILTCDTDSMEVFLNPLDTGY